MVNSDPAARRALPSVDRLLSNSAVATLVARFGHVLTTDTIRALLQMHRDKLAQNASAFEFDEARFTAECEQSLLRQTQPSLRPVFNLSGTVLHTNLGRAVMPQSVADAVMIAMTRPVNLEFDLDGGARGERDTHVEKWITRLAGADVDADVLEARAVQQQLEVALGKTEPLVAELLFDPRLVVLSQLEDQQAAEIGRAHV